MNIHPVFVHFPVAFLFVYSLLEIFRFKWLTGNHWFYTKTVLVIVGELGAITAWFVGDWAWADYHQTFLGPAANHIISTHSDMGGMVVWFFGAVAFFYLVGWIRRSGARPLGTSVAGRFLWHILVSIERIVTGSILGILIGLIGAGLIGFTAALGGLIAYGPQNDPVSAALFKFLTGY